MTVSEVGCLQAAIAGTRPDTAEPDTRLYHETVAALRLSIQPCHVIKADQDMS